MKKSFFKRKPWNRSRKVLMPDLRTITTNDQDNTTGVQFPDFDDRVDGIWSLIQIVSDMLFLDDFGAFGQLLNRRISSIDLADIVISGTKLVEAELIKEQADMNLPESEVLDSLKLNNINLAASDRVEINYQISNAEGQTTTFVI